MRQSRRAASPEDGPSSKRVRRSARVVPQRGGRGTKKTNTNAKRPRRRMRIQAEVNVAGPSGNGSATRDQQVVEDNAEKEVGIVRAGTEGGNE